MTDKQETGDLRDQRASLVAKGIDPNLDRLPTARPEKEQDRVKPLEWRDGRTDETVFGIVQRATILGAENLVGLEYTILGPDRHCLFEVILGDKVINCSNSEEQAKAAAQADYERRILSALTE